MAKEKLETTNKLIISNAWKDEDKAKEILKSLEAISDEEIMRAWEEIEKSQKKLENPQELKDFREAWKEKMEGISGENKEKIIKSVEQIPVKVEIDSDGTRLIEFKLWNKIYKILDPRLENYTDYKYGFTLTHINRECVKLWWMRWDDVDLWKNEKLKEYVKEKQGEWLHIPKIEEMKSILQELWKEASLSAEKDQIAMLIYLTGMDWIYWLSMWDNKKSGSKVSRSWLYCHNYTYWFCFYDIDFMFASLCMIACEEGSGL